MKTKIVKGKTIPEQVFKSKKHFFWRFSQLKKNGGEIKLALQPCESDIKEYNRIELAVRRRVRWELGSECFNVWDIGGDKDIPTLAKAYRIK